MDPHVLKFSHSYQIKQESSPTMFGGNNCKPAGEIYNSVPGPTGYYQLVDHGLAGLVVFHPDGFTTTPASDAEQSQHPLLKKLGEHSTAMLNGTWTAQDLADVQPRKELQRRGVLAELRDDGGSIWPGNLRDAEGGDEGSRGTGNGVAESNQGEGEGSGGEQGMDGAGDDTVDRSDTSQY